MAEVVVDKDSSGGVIMSPWSHFIASQFSQASFTHVFVTVGMVLGTMLGMVPSILQSS